MGRRKRFAAVLAPVAAGVSALALGTGTAGAAMVTDARLVTYTTFAGLPVTCLVTSRQSFDPTRSDEAFAETSVTGLGGCVTESDATIRVTYLAPGGVPASGTVSGGREVSATWKPVADDFRSRHEVHFGNCDPDRDRCDFDVTLVQPK